MCVFFRLICVSCCIVWLCSLVGMLLGNRKFLV